MVANRNSRQELCCRWCGKPAGFHVPTRPRTFCSPECNRAWRGEKLKGNKLRQHFKPANSFLSGHEPWNKGLQGIHLSPATEFKPGNDGTRTLPVGAVTIRDDKQGKPRAWVKVSEPNQWIPRARFVWIAAGRLIPRGSVIHHSDRDTLNDEIENLELLTRAQHADEHREELKDAQWG